MMEKLTVTTSLVRTLIDAQFPQWKDLPIEPVATVGWDNFTFHLGKLLLIRLPSAPVYALQVEKEQRWLPKLAPLLPVAIPVPVAMGQPAAGYPLHWSIYKWLDGETAASKPPAHLKNLAKELAHFLKSLHNIDTHDGPPPGLHSFHRGGSLSVYDSETKEALAKLPGKIDTARAEKLWNTALSTQWERKPVWVHGDMSAGNLLLKEGKLSAVIDFGQLAVGDPACDLAIAWTLFDEESRDLFKKELPLDTDTWLRGQAWTLWKALKVAAGYTDPNNAESKQCWNIIQGILL